MAKKQTQPIELDQAANVSAIAESVSKLVFDTELRKIKDDLEKQGQKTDGIAIGAVIVAILFVLGIIYDSHVFMSEYNQHYLDMQKDNDTLKRELEDKVNRLSDKQDYLERVILDKSVLKK